MTSKYLEVTVLVEIENDGGFFHSRLVWMKQRSPSSQQWVKDEIDCVERLGIFPKKDGFSLYRLNLTLVSFRTWEGEWDSDLYVTRKRFIHWRDFPEYYWSKK